MPVQNYTLLLHALILVSIFDASGFSVGGVTIRVAWLFAPLIMLFVRLKPITLVELCFLFSFCFFHLISSLYNQSYPGLSYIVWILFNFFIFYRVAASIEIYSIIDVSKIFIISGRIQVIIGAILVFLSQHDRLTFTYYEPSYMAIGLVPYLVFSILRRRVDRFDLFCIILFVALGESALFVLLLLITLSVKILSTNKKHTLFVFTALFFFLSTFFIIDSYNNESRANHILIKKIVDNGIDITSLVERAGNRFPRMEAAYEVFVDNLLFGVGSMNYSNYISNIDFSHITGGVPWLEVQNLPPVNIFIEAGLNAGIFGSLLLFAVFARFTFTTLIRGNDYRYFLIVFLIFVAGLIESNYLRAYCWLFFGIVAGQTLNNRKKFRSSLQSTVKVS
jgi:hypothetical protein